MFDNSGLAMPLTRLREFGRPLKPLTPLDTPGFHSEVTGTVFENQEP